MDAGTRRAGVTRGVAVVALLAVAPLLAGSAPARAAGVRACASAQLVVRVGRPSGTAGTIYYPLVLTNRRATCVLWGVPALQPVAGPTGRAVGPPARNASIGKMPVRHIVARGASVSVAWGVSEIGNYPPAWCRAVPAWGVVIALRPFLAPRRVRLASAVCTRLASTTTRLVTPGVTGT
ncbi:MAG: DUF4232 domain-containing protein [Acidimicrobiales bacterium]